MTWCSGEWMEREGEEDQDKDGWTHSWVTRAEPPSATWDDTPEIGRDGEELPRMSPGVGCDSTAQGNCQKESTSLKAVRNEIYRNRRNMPPLKSLPQPTRTWHCTCREPICKCCYGRRRTSLTLQMYNWLSMDGKWRNMSTSCLPFIGSQLHHRNSWKSSGTATKRSAKSVVEGVAMDPMECRGPVTVSVKEAFLL